MGLRYRRRWAYDRADVAGAGRHRRRQRPAQAMDRGVWRVAGDRLLPDVDRQAGRSGGDSAVVDRLRYRYRRRRIRHGVQQRHDAVAGAAGKNWAAVRHRLGHRIYRRHSQPYPGAGISRSQSGHRPHAVRTDAAVRARCGVPPGRSHHGAADRRVVRHLCVADVFADAGFPGEAAGARSPARRPARIARDAERTAETQIDGGVPARQHDLHRWAGLAVRIRWHLCCGYFRLAHYPNRHVRHPARGRRHVRRLVRRQAR